MSKLAQTRECFGGTLINASSNAVVQLRHLLPPYENNGSSSGVMHTQAHRVVMGLIRTMELALNVEKAEQPSTRPSDLLKKTFPK